MRPCVFKIVEHQNKIEKKRQNDEIINGPYNIFVNQDHSVYVSDKGNHRVMRWLKGATQGNAVLGGNEAGREINQFNYPSDLSFDRQNNLYVVDNDNNRVQKFNISNQI